MSFSFGTGRPQFFEQVEDIATADDHSDRFNRKEAEERHKPWARETFNNRPQTSRYLGVKRSEATGKWISMLQHGDSTAYLGIFDTEIQAALKHDKSAHQFGLPMNFSRGSKVLARPREGVMVSSTLEGGGYHRDDDDDDDDDVYFERNRHYRAAVHHSSQRRQGGDCDKQWSADTPGTRSNALMAVNNSRWQNDTFGTDKIEAGNGVVRGCARSRLFVPPLQKQQGSISNTQRLESARSLLCEKAEPWAWDERSGWEHASQPSYDRKRRYSQSDADDAGFQVDFTKRWHSGGDEQPRSNSHQRAFVVRSSSCPEPKAKTKGYTSKFKGVSWNKEKGRWATYMAIEGRYTYLGRFDDEEEAARKYDEHAASLGKPLNFPDEAEASFERYIKSKKSSLPGVSWNQASKKWVSQAQVDGATVYLGLFDDEDDAAHKHSVFMKTIKENVAADAVVDLSRTPKAASSERMENSSNSSPSSGASSLSRHLPFFSIDPNPSTPSSAAACLTKEKATNRFHGVSWSRSLQRFRAQLHVDGQDIYLGYFGSEVEAARVVDEHAVRLGKPPNFPESKPQSSARQPFVETAGATFGACGEAKAYASRAVEKHAAEKPAQSMKSNGAPFSLHHRLGFKKAAADLSGRSARAPAAAPVSTRVNEMNSRVPHPNYEEYSFPTADSPPPGEETYEQEATPIAEGRNDDDNDDDDDGAVSALLTLSCSKARGGSYTAEVGTPDA